MSIIKRIDFKFSDFVSFRLLFNSTILKNFYEIICFKLTYVVSIVPQNSSSPSSSTSFEKGIHSGSNTNSTGVEGLSIYHPQNAVLPKSNAGSDGVEPESDFVMQNHQTLCSMRCPMYEARYYNVFSGFFDGTPLAIAVKEKWNRSTPVGQRLHSIQAVRGKLSSTGLALLD